MNVPSKLSSQPTVQNEYFLILVSCLRFILDIWHSDTWCCCVTSPALSSGQGWEMPSGELCLDCSSENDKWMLLKIMIIIMIIMIMIMKNIMNNIISTRFRNAVGWNTFKLQLCKYDRVNEGDESESVALFEFGIVAMS